ncbi:MAG: radical SAM protein [Lachnospiraceae bacterium]|nr:radical SAM protein [Lachnospiraceae bacterium]
MYNLRMCVWEITLACCFSCKYCGSSGGKARENELTTEECLNVADQLHELGCRRVSMIGGEVFMRRDWKEIVKRLTGHGIRVNIITNGFTFKESLINDLKEVNIESVSVSLDGPEEVHDKYRQEGSYDRAVRALEALLSAGIPVSVISTLNSENVGHLEEMYSLLRKYTIYAWQLQACSPMGNAANNGIDYKFDMMGVIDFVCRHMYEAPFAMGVADNIGYFTEAEGSIRGNLSGRAYFKGCSAGISSIGIDSIGNVRGCESMYDEHFNEGNLRKETLKEIWEDPNRFAYNRKFTKEMLTGKCAECELGEYCGGGCRSYNYFVHGKIYESPFCAGGAKISE